MSKFTWPQIVSFSRSAAAYLAEDEKRKDTKLGYAIKRVTQQLEKLQSEYLQQREDIQINNAATDKDGVLLTETGGDLRYTPDGLKMRNKLWRELDEREIFEVEPYFTTEAPELSEEYQRAFSGFVVKPEESRLEAVA